jgi:hypothetical protein
MMPVASYRDRPGSRIVATLAAVEAARLHRELFRPRKARAANDGFCPNVNSLGSESLNEMRAWVEARHALVRRTLIGKNEKQENYNQSKEVARQSLGPQTEERPKGRVV